jgi:putative oxidoreductase
MTTPLKSRIAALVARYEKAADHLRSPLLLVLRVVWGWGFFQAGKGKLGNLDGATEFFASLNIPAPRVNALAAASTECLGGLLLLVGLGSRFAALALTFTMLVAYATAHRDSLGDLDQIVVQAPFPFLVASLVVLAFGPGAVSVDGWLAKRRSSKLE